MYVGNGLYIDAVFENVEIAYTIENYEPVLSAKEKWSQSKLDYEINVGLLGISSEDIVK
jgi:hypothetical protein